MTTDQTPDRCHRAVLTVTATSRPDGGNYFDQADFAAHVTGWVRAALRDKHAVAKVTISEAPAVPSAAAPPTQAANPRRLAEAPQPETQAEAVAALLASPCDACRHTLNWHRNDVGCTVALCVCSRFQPPVTVAPAVVAQPGKEN
jgi:hypothetical protein